MILQALYEYYQRKAADPGSTIAPHGLEWKEIPYHPLAELSQCILDSSNGSIINVI